MTATLATETLPPALEAVVAKLVDDDTRELAVPKGLLAETTQDAYGYYMSILGKLPPFPGLSEAGSLMLWGVVLCRSGANEAGIRSALRVMT